MEQPSNTLVEDPVAMLEEYQKTGNIELRNKLLVHYSYIAKSVAVQTRGITSAYAQVEDIVNEGVITLVDCLHKYTPDKGMKFENYAYMRIKNATIDFVRKQDWVPRRIRRTAREISEAYNTLSTKLLREPSTKELADYLNITQQEVNKHYSEIATGTVLSFEELLQTAANGNEPSPLQIAANENAQPERGLLQSELREQLIKAIDALTEKERTVVSLYYFEHLKLREIASIMEVSESRVSQTHSKAIMKMKHRLQIYMNG